MTLAEQVEALKEARASLFMWNMDVSGIDRILEQHGVDTSQLDQYPPCVGKRDDHKLTGQDAA